MNDISRRSFLKSSAVATMSALAASIMNTPVMAEELEPLPSAGTVLEPAREVPAIECDVFVAGAGTAGVIAAIAAARAGASVVMVEKMPAPGGTLCNGGIGINSMFAVRENPEDAERIVGGLCYELMDRMTQENGTTGFLYTPNNDQKTHYRMVADHEIHKGVVCEMLLEAGVHLMLQTYFCGVRMEGSKITAAFIENKSGRSAIVAKQYIDCSGDGDVAEAAGVEQVEIWQDYDQVVGAPCGMVFGIGGIDFDRVVEENPNGAYRPVPITYPNGENLLGSGSLKFVHGRETEKYAPLNELDINFFTSFNFLHENESVYVNNSKGVKLNAAEAEGLTQGEMEMRIKIMRMANAFKACVPGFEKSYITWASNQLGIRASKVTVCDYDISQEEIANATRFEDEIGLYGFHDYGGKDETCLPKAPGFYGFPYRMLLAKGCDNLYMAGRNVTTDIYAHMSTRNTVGCMIMGQGAGVAAALCAQKGCMSRELPYEELREKLLEQGVVLEPQGLLL
ncbi:MAG: FAD-dependent oxidoreductase [Lachnospiraceae bacterium]|nr:FAD-dependent oxidoreductase [Lachnospiraceae bacterium]